MLFKQNVKTQNRPLKKLHLRLKTDLSALSEVLDRFEKIASPRLSRQLYWECQLALAESFTNVVRHAHQGLPQSTPIDLEIALFPRGLEIRIWDSGQPFDWQGQLRAKLQGDRDPWALGGRGLCLIARVMDDYRYIPAEEGDRNCLVLWKQIPQSYPQQRSFISFFKRVVRKIERVLRRVMGLLARKFSALVIKLNSVR
ncbi:ATP-binding protein [Spirulina sp. 06S082]|uniref:ATP-binding protein n=1 Tax=Spirulina sp. 06S082 TaxID=3110248 RepID=UPI002B1ED88C|nr:ATP-binding protein [Spirulina sp. 06S082]MEA5468238.1 ATP-binding protein [Spirulina sp. 06S082]